MSTKMRNAIAIRYVVFEDAARSRTSSLRVASRFAIWRRASTIWRTRRAPISSSCSAA
jgi:hypothetical protein